jgi:hypothetical protein
MTTYRVFGRRDALSGVFVPVVEARRMMSHETQHDAREDCGVREGMWLLNGTVVCGECCDLIGRLRAGRYSEVRDEERSDGK